MGKVITKSGRVQVCVSDVSFTPWLQPGDHTLFLQYRNRFNGLLRGYKFKGSIGKPLKRFPDFGKLFPTGLKPPV